MVSCACAGMMKYERLRAVMLCGLFLFDCRTRELLRKRQTMRTYANFKKYERMLLTVIAKTSRCYHRKEHSL